jgi:hemolysin type calcium-binding protein/WD40 repeat protein
MRAALVIILAAVAIPGAVPAQSDRPPLPNSTTPRWSADGTKIAFASNLDSRSSERSQYVVNADGTNLHARTPADGEFVEKGFGIGPVTSPDGQWRAWVANRRVFLAPTDGNSSPSINEPATGVAWRDHPGGSAYTLLVSDSACRTSPGLAVKLCDLRVFDNAPGWKLPLYGPTYDFETAEVSDFQVAPGNGSIAWTQRVGPPDASASEIFSNGSRVTPSPCAYVERRCLDGNDGGNRLSGSPRRDVIFGEGGSDTIRTIGGWDFVDAGPANDVVSSGAGNDTVFGGSGNDDLSTGAGRDFVNPGSSYDPCSRGRETTSFMQLTAIATGSIAAAAATSSGLMPASRKTGSMPTARSSTASGACSSEPRPQRARRRPLSRS